MPRSEHPGNSAAFCAIDLGAQSGRVILVHLVGETLGMKEVHRFPNDPVHYGGSLHWDVPRLWWEICRGLESLGEERIDGIGVDAWGVDYALLGARGELLQNPYHYRDARTRGAMEFVFKRVPKEEIYRVAGIQMMPINTLFQLAAASPRSSMRRSDSSRFRIFFIIGSRAAPFANSRTPRRRNW